MRERLIGSKVALTRPSENQCSGFAEVFFGVVHIAGSFENCSKPATDIGGSIEVLTGRGISRSGFLGGFIEISIFGGFILSRLACFAVANVERKDTNFYLLLYRTPSSLVYSYVCHFPPR